MKKKMPIIYTDFDEEIHTSINNSPITYHSMYTKKISDWTTVCNKQDGDGCQYAFR